MGSRQKVIIKMTERGEKIICSEFGLKSCV